MLSRMNGSSSTAFSGSLVQNDSASIIVSERWGERGRGREDLYLPSLRFLSSVTPSLSRLPFSPSLSLPVYIPSEGATTSLLPWSRRAGGWEGGEIIWRRGGGICAGCHSETVDRMHRASWLPQQQTPPLCPSSAQ